MHGWADECEGSNRVCGRDRSTVLDDQTDVHVLVFLVLSYGDDPFELIYKVGEAKNDTKGDDGTKEAEKKNVLEVFLEIILLEVVSSSKDHGWKESIEEDFLAEIDVTDFCKKIDNKAEKQSNDDADASLMNDMDL